MGELEGLVFKSKEEVDDWYNHACDGISKAVALEFNENKGFSHSDGDHYLPIFNTLYNIKRRAYENLNISEEPSQYCINRKISLPILKRLAELKGQK